MSKNDEGQMNVTILGVDHLTQRLDDEGRLGSMIQKFCKEKDIDLIAEEWSTGRWAHEPTLGRVVANSLSIGWRNVDMTDEQMEALGILDCIRRRRPQVNDIAGTTFQEIDDAVYMPKADRLREEYWIQRIQESRPHNVLVVCGLIHVEPLAERMRATGFHVMTATLCEQEWYRDKYSGTCDQVELKRKEESC